MKRIKEIINNYTIIAVLINLVSILLYVFIIKTIWKSNYGFMDFIYMFIIGVLVCRSCKSEVRLKAIELILDQGVNDEKNSKN